MKQGSSAGENTLVVQPEEGVSLGKLIVLGLQHVLAMDVYVVPFIVASIVSLSVSETGQLIQATLFAAGIATIVQSQWCMKLPIAQGASYVPLGAVAGIALAAGGGVVGLNAVFGAMIPGAMILIIIGLTPLFRRVVNFLIPPLVGGTIIFVVGISLIPIGLEANVFNQHANAGTLHQNVVLAGVTACFLIASVMVGLRLGRRGIWVRVGSVLIALIGGCLLAAAWGIYDGGDIARTPWFSLPNLAFVSFTPTFSIPAIFTMLIIYAVLIAESTGTWFAVSAVIQQPLSNAQFDRGVLGEGIGCFLSALVGATPVTGFSTNAGIVAITGVASRFVFIGVGAWLIFFGLSGKLTVAIASIPEAVIGGIFMVVCAIIALSGIRVLRRIRLDERNMLVIGMPVVVSLFLVLAPDALIQSLPEFLQYLLDSSIATGAVVAISLNQILPSAKINN